MSIEQINFSYVPNLYEKCNLGCVTLESCVSRCENHLYTTSHYYLWILIISTILTFLLLKFSEDKYVKKYNSSILLFIFVINLITLFYEGFW